LNDQNDGERPLWAVHLPDDEYAWVLRGLFGVLAAAAYLGTSDRYVYKLVSKGKLPARRVGKYLRIQKVHLDGILGFE
jgi:excisionase family DNA binding protein